MGSSVTAGEGILMIPYVILEITIFLLRSLFEPVEWDELKEVL